MFTVIHIMLCKHTTYYIYGSYNTRKSPFQTSEKGFVMQIASANINSNFIRGQRKFGEVVQHGNKVSNIMNRFEYEFIPHQH